MTTQTTGPRTITIVQLSFTDTSMFRMEIPVERGHPAELHELFPDGSLGPGLGYRLETDDEFKLRLMESLREGPAACEHDYSINHAGPVNTKCIKCGHEIEG